MEKRAKKKWPFSEKMHGEFQQPLSVNQPKESKILMLLPIMRWITSDWPSMCALLSLGTFFLFCSFESVLFWKYYKRDTFGVTFCHVSNSNAVAGRHVEISTSGFF